VSAVSLAVVAILAGAGPKVELGPMRQVSVPPRTGRMLSQLHVFEFDVRFYP
jgi:hypothetical protein